MKVEIFKVYWCKCGNAVHPHRVSTECSKCGQGIKVDKDKHGKGNFKTYVWEIEGRIAPDRGGGEIPNYCCEKMMEALDEDFITFGNPDYRLNKKASSLSITKQHWGTEIMAIKFCPFCGEKIEYEECGDYEQE